MPANLDPAVAAALAEGVVIPACPLALARDRKFDERAQRALIRYYASAGAGGLAVGVHTTQFQIRDPRIGLFHPVLALAAAELDRLQRDRVKPIIKIAGVCGLTKQAVLEAHTAAGLGYHAGLLNVGMLKDADEKALLNHCREVASVLPVVGFYLQEAAGGRKLDYSFWARFAEIENVVAIKIAAFNRYRTLDVIRAITESGRGDIALYTGNDDNIVVDLLTPFRFRRQGEKVERRIVGGLLGQWAVWTRKAVELLAQCHQIALGGLPIPTDMMSLAADITDANGAIFDSAGGFAGCIPGIHEILRRQGLLEGIWTLDPNSGLSPGQMREIDRVCAAYPHLQDDEFVAHGRERWLDTALA